MLSLIHDLLIFKSEVHLGLVKIVLVGKFFLWLLQSHMVKALHRCFPCSGGVPSLSGYRVDFNISVCSCIVRGVVFLYVLWGHPIIKWGGVWSSSTY